MSKVVWILGAAALAISIPSAARTPEQTAAASLKAAPVWDGHNDVPEQLRERRRNVLGAVGAAGSFDFADTAPTADPKTGKAAMQTDLKRLRAGHVGAQFWSVYVSTGLTDQQAVQATIEQIDVMKRVIARSPRDLQFCTDSKCVEAAWKAGKVASLLGMEGGHSVAGSLGVLRQTYELGARYMTLTHFKNTPWADSATDAPAHGGLTDHGRDVVREMQRLGMLVDLSHVSAETMLDTLEIARAPVIFSHSGAGGVDGHPRNVPDAVLDKLKANGGIVMVVTAPAYVSAEVRDWNAQRAGEKARLEAFDIGFPDAAKDALAKWEKANPTPVATIGEVANHIDYIAKRIGADHIGIGGDFDGIDDTTQGMADVSTYPALFTELARRGWSQADLEKVASRNTMRVLKAAEAFAAAHRGDPPIEDATTF